MSKLTAQPTDTLLFAQTLQALTKM